MLASSLIGFVFTGAPVQHGERVPYNREFRIAMHVPVVPTHDVSTDQANALTVQDKYVRIPEHLFMPPNPPAPGRGEAISLGLLHLLAQRTTNYYHASASQAKNIELVAKRLNRTVVQPGEVFSYTEHVGPYTEAHGYGWGRAFDGDHIVPSLAGGVCQGASTLYSTLLRTGLPIVERHNHGLTVPYLPAGEDATVATSVHYDFRFLNNQNTPILITAKAFPEKRFLTVAIWGAKQGPHIDVEHRVLNRTPYQTIRKSIVGDTMPKIRFPGQVGATVETWVSVQSKGHWTEKIVSKDTYLPSPRVVEVPLKK